MNAMRKYTSIGVTAGVIAGGALGFGLSSAGLISASPGQSSSTPAAEKAPPHVAGLVPAQAHDEDSEGRVGPPLEQIDKMEAHFEHVRDHVDGIRMANATRLAERLTPLVENGTLTQEQVDAIVSHLHEDHLERVAEMRARAAERFSAMRAAWDSEDGESED
jgi:hypothetical protein